MLWVLIVIFIWAITISFNKYWQAPISLSNFAHLAKMSVFTLGISLILCAACYSVGNLLRCRLIGRRDHGGLTLAMLDIATGFMIYTLILMAFGAFHLLNSWIMAAILAQMLLANYQKSISFFHGTLWKRIDSIEKFGFWGIFLGVLLIFYLTMNYLYSQSPFPLGFDARNYYINISRLIGDANGLVEGYAPHAWALVQATGYLLANSPELSLFISTLGGILSLFTMHELSVKHLKLSEASSVGICLLFIVTPAITNHWIIEYKIDLALLFVQLSMINAFIGWVKQKSLNSPDVLKRLEKKDFGFMILLGLVGGFTLSIKVLSLFLLFGLAIALWYYAKDWKGSIGVSSIVMGLIITLKLDEMSGMREYHLSANETGVALLIIGVALLLYSLIQSRKSFLSATSLISTFALCSLLTFGPWVYKNYVFSKSTNIMTLVLGGLPQTEFRAYDLIRNHRALEREEQQNQQENK